MGTCPRGSVMTVPVAVQDLALFPFATLSCFPPPLFCGAIVTLGRVAMASALRATAGLDSQLVWEST